MRKSKKKEIEFYIKDIGILDWLVNDEDQKIRFVDRFEYRSNNKLHRDNGPAIEFFDGTGNQYYVKGNKLSYEEFQNYTRTKLMDKILEK